MNMEIPSERKYLYKAFISYRHLDFDKNIAEKVQKYLESFKNKQGEKWRIFRDESELPTSNDLSNDIRKALDNSEFLIVICSEKTKESRWCTEEVVYFKSLHDNTTQNILTLLISGNPEDIFIRELCTTKKEIIDDNGNKEVKEVTVEPLAANISAASKRESFAKLKSEILRIIAPMAGLRYDDLYNRRRRNKNRILFLTISTIAALAIAFGLYNAYMLANLKKSYELRDVENARYLVAQSEMLWRNGEYAAAQSTLLRAFPEDSSKVIPEVENLLAMEQGAYEIESMQPIGKIDVDGVPENMFFVAEGKRFVVVTRDKIIIYDVDSCEKKAEFLATDFSDYNFYKKIVLPQYSINKLNDSRLIRKNDASSFEYTTAGLIYSSYENDAEIEGYAQEGDVFYIVFQEGEGNYQHIKSIYEVSVISGTCKEIKKEMLSEEVADRMTKLAEENLDTVGNGLNRANSMKYENNRNYYVVEPKNNMFGVSNILLKKYSEDNEYKWEYKADYTFDETHGIVYIQKHENANDKNLLVLIAGNSISIIDDESGEEIQSFWLEEEIVNYYYTEGGIVYIYLENGKEYGLYLAKANKANGNDIRICHVNDFLFDIANIAYHKGVYAVVNAADLSNSSKSTPITFYSKIKNNNAQELISSLDEMDGSGNRVFNLSGNKMICYGYNVAYLYDFENKRLEKIINTKDEDESIRIDEVKFLNDDLFLIRLYISTSNYDNRIYDSETNKMLKTFHSSEAYGYSPNEILKFALTDKETINRFNPFSNFYKREIGFLEYQNMIYSGDGSKCLVDGGGLGYILFNLETGEDIYLDIPDYELSGSIGYNDKLWLSDNGDSACVVKKKKAYYFDDSGKLINSYELLREDIRDVLLINNNIFMLDAKGVLYHAENGGNLSRIEVDYGREKIDRVAKIKYIEKYNYVMIYTGTSTRVIDMKSGKVRFTIDDNVDYNAVIDKFILYNKYKTYAFPVYPVGTIYLQQ